MCSDKEIFDTIKRDKVAGVRQLFERYYRPLLLFANEFLHNWEESRDIVQDQFLRFLEKDYLQQVSPNHLGTYLFASVKYSCIRKESKKEVLLKADELKDFDSPIEALQTVNEEQLEKVSRALEALPARSRQAIEYVVIRDYSYKQAAEEMGISVNTIKYLLKEGIRKLRNTLSSSFLEALFILFRKEK